MRTIAAAISSLLEADPSLIHFDGEVPTGDSAPKRYVVFYLTTPRDGVRRSSADAGLGLYRLSTLYVGGSPNECRWVIEHAHAALKTKRPTADSSPILLGSSGQVRHDKSINPPAWIATDVWQFSVTA